MTSRPKRGGTLLKTSKMRFPLAYVRYLRFVPFSCLKNYAYKLRVHSEMAGAAHAWPTTLRWLLAVFSKKFSTPWLWTGPLSHNSDTPWPRMLLKSFLHLILIQKRNLTLILKFLKFKRRINLLGVPLQIQTSSKDRVGQMGSSGWTKREVWLHSSNFGIRAQNK